MKKSLLIMIGMALAVSGCKSQAPVAEADQANSDMALKVRQGALVGAPQPKAVVYRMNGDYADHPFVNLSADGQSLIYYPGPGDVSAERSAPIAIGDGYYLCRQGGIGVNSRFLTWTYEEYSQLAEAPTQAEILSHIIPGARALDVRTLPIPLSEAEADPAALRP